MAKWNSPWTTSIIRKRPPVGREMELHNLQSMKKFAEFWDDLESGARHYLLEDLKLQFEIDNREGTDRIPQRN